MLSLLEYMITINTLNILLSDGLNILKQSFRYAVAYSSVELACSVCTSAPWEQSVDNAEMPRVGLRRLCITMESSGSCTSGRSTLLGSGVVYWQAVLALELLLGLYTSGGTTVLMLRWMSNICFFIFSIFPWALPYRSCWARQMTKGYSCVDSDSDRTERGHVGLLNTCLLSWQRSSLPAIIAIVFQASPTTTERVGKSLSCKKIRTHTSVASTLWFSGRGFGIAFNRSCCLPCFFVFGS